MAAKMAHTTDHTLEGDTILERLAATKVPSGLKPFAAAFKAQHAKYTAAGKVVSAAKAARDAALAAIASADDVLDGHVLALANELVGAKLGDRKNPFRDYSSHSPANLVDLAYQVEATEVTKLLKKLQSKKPAKPVQQAAALCEKSVRAVETALRKLTAPQAAYAKALAARDALLLDWTKALNKLKLNGRAVWADEPATAKALFAPPERIRQSHPKKRAPKAAPASSAQPAPAPAVAPPATGP